MVRQLGVLESPFVPDLKRLLLLFDELVVPDLASRLEDIRDLPTRADLEWLSSEGALSGFDRQSLGPPPPTQSADLQDVLRRMAGSYALIQGAGWLAWPNEDGDGFRNAVHIGMGGFAVAMLRDVAGRLASDDVHAAPVLRTFGDATPEAVLADWRTMYRRVADVLDRKDEVLRSLESAEDQELFERAINTFAAAAKRFSELRDAGLPELGSPTDVVAVTLKALPSVGPTVGLEDLLSFVRDPAVSAQRARLHRWMRRLGRNDLAPTEIADELAELVDIYTSHLAAAEIARHSVVLEALIIVPAESAEKLVRFRFGEAAKALFGIRRTKAALMEAELRYPGREVAYVVEATKRFG